MFMHTYNIAETAINIGKNSADLRIKNRCWAMAVRNGYSKEYAYNEIYN